MPDENPEPVHPLDRVLRAQAARRRTALGAEQPVMPGSTRAQLHDELARVERRAAREESSRPGFFAGLFRGTRALATVGAAILLVGLFAWNEGWFSGRPAARSKAPAAAAPVENSVAQAPDAAKERLDTPAKSLADKDEASSAPAAPVDSVASVAPKQAPPAPPATAAKPQPSAPVVAAAPAASEPRPESGPVGVGTPASEMRQSFSNLAPADAESARRARGALAKDKRSTEPLNEFEFRQDGNRIEIIDADGSVYAGEIDLRTKKDNGVTLAERERAASAPADAAKPAEAKAKVTAQAKATSEFNFRASGINQTLRQKVTIEGVYQAPLEQDRQNAPVTAMGGAVKQEEQKSARPARMQQNQSRARVMGRAQINGRDVPVNAEATK